MRDYRIVYVVVIGLILGVLWVYFRFYGMFILFIFGYDCLDGFLSKVGSCCFILVDLRFIDIFNFYEKNVFVL